MAIAMYVNDDPNASAGSALFMTGLGVAFVLLALVLYRPLSAQARGTIVHRRPNQSDLRCEWAALDSRLRVMLV